MEKRKKIMCEYEGCQKEAQYALYRFYPDFTKKWVNVCDIHDRRVAQEGRRLRAASEVAWKEVR